MLKEQVSFLNLVSNIFPCFRMKKIHYILNSLWREVNYLGLAHQNVTFTISFHISVPVLKSSLCPGSL